MSKSNTTETDVLNLIFKATAYPWNANTDLYVALHTADPGEGGSQTTSEVSTVAYVNYARVAVPRSGLGWTVSGDTSSNAALIQFAQAGVGSAATISHVSIGTAASGAGQILYSGALNDNLAVANLIQPQFSIGALQITED